MSKLPPRDTYDPDVAAEICRRIAEGEPLRSICGPDRAAGIPERVTVYNWLHRHPKFAVAYHLARRAQAELYLDQVVEIADGRDDQGDEPRDVRRDALRVKARHWTTLVIATKLYPGLPERLPPDEREQDHIAARIAAILEGARRRRLARGDPMTGDLLHDLQQPSSGQEAE